MQSHIANRFGVAASTIAVLAAIASVWAVMLPYRLSLFQRAVLDTALWVQLAGPLLAVGFGSAALRGDTRSRILGFTAIALSVLAFVMAMSASHVHSGSRL
jgi:hypothetical protein